jgi:hypothetical protein
MVSAGCVMVRKKVLSLGVESLEARTLLTAMPLGLTGAVAAVNNLKLGWRATETRTQAQTSVMHLESVPAAAASAAADVARTSLLAAQATAVTPIMAGGIATTFNRADLADVPAGITPLKRSRPAAAIIKTPKPAPQGNEIVTPPNLTGATKQVEITIGAPTGKTQQPLGLNVGSMSYWGQGNAVNNMITQGGGFELANSKVVLHAADGSTGNTLVADGDWTWDTIGRSAMVGRTLAGSTGVNKFGTWTITNAQPEIDGSGNATGRTLVTIGGNFAAAPAKDDTFAVELLNVNRSYLSDQTSAWGTATIGRDLTVAHGGSASVKVTLGGGADNGAALTYYFGADATAGRNVLRHGHTYQFTFWARTDASAGGSAAATLSLSQGNNAGAVTLPLIADGQWHQYALTVAATNPVVYENGIGSLLVRGANASVNVDDIKLIDLNDVLPGTTLSKEVVSLVREYGFSSLRFWHGEMRWARLDDIIGTPENRPMVQGLWDTYDMQFGLPEMLQLAKETGTSPWIVIPTGWSNADVHNLMEYLGGSADTAYGAKRVADGHAGSWFADLRIRIEAGNESWNGIFWPNAYYPFDPYWERAEDMFHTFKTDPLYSANASRLELVVNGWQWVPWYTEQSLRFVPSADAVDISAYTSGPNTDIPLNQVLGGVLTQQMSENASQLPSTLFSFGKKIYVYEESMGELQGTLPAATESAYATSLGAGLAVMRNAMQLSRDYGISVQNLFTMFQRGLALPNGYTLGHYGIFSDLGTAATNPRPIALGAKLLNQASGEILDSSLSSGWVVDSTSTIPAAQTTQAADAMVTFDGANFVVTMFNNTIADLENTNFHFALPTSIDGKLITADWSKATFKVLTGPAVGSNNETDAPVVIADGTYTHGTREVYAALPGHSMGSLVIPIAF